MSIPGMVPGPVPTPPQPATLVANGQPVSGTSSASSGMSFGDILDTINPLQHIPVLSSLYRAATGSHISSGAQIAGDTLYGALLPGGAIMGFASSAADIAVKEATGSGISQHVVSAVSGSSATNNAAASGSSAPTSTPLVANTPVAGKAPLSDVTASAFKTITHLSHDTQTGNTRYQRVQAFDALNKKLVKMAV